MGNYISDILFKKFSTASSGGGITLSEAKADTQIADAITKKHASGSDNQDISSKVDKVTNYSLVLNTEISKIHSNTLDHAAGSDNQDLSGKINTNDGRLSDARTPITHSHAPGDITGTSVVTNDARLSDARTPLTHNHDTLYNPKRLFTNLAASVVTSGTTEKVLVQLQIPAARAVSGSTFRAWVVGNSSSTGTLIFKVRSGAGGTITDAIGWTAVTSAAQAANARAGFEVLITVRSATTLYTDGVGYAGAVQLPTYVAAPAVSAVTISGTWYISLTVICSSGTFTAQVGTIEEIR